MTHRSAAAALALAFSLAIPAVALADVPPADGGSGTGGSASGVLNADCTVVRETEAGETCQQCQFSGSDSSCQDELGSDYNFVCQYSSTVEIWCNGPSRTVTQTPGCALGGPAAPLHGGALAGLVGAVAAALAMRRRRG